MSIIHIIRHGESAANVDGIIQGQGGAGAGLSEKGREKIGELAERLKDCWEDWGIKAVYASDSKRARQTAEIIAALHDAKVETSELLREHNMGQWEGKKKEDFEIATGDHVRSWDAKVSPDVESDREVLTRVLQFLREVSAKHQNGEIFVVTHGGVMRCLLMHFEQGDHESLPVGCVRNGGYMSVRVQGDDLSLKYADESRKTIRQIADYRLHLEQDLKVLLKESGSNATLADVKKLIYEEQETDDMNDVVRLFDNGDISIFENALDLVTDAWNYFPHKILGGLAPVEVD